MRTVENRRERLEIMKLLYTRHGQTDWNVQQKIQGRTDICLNERGREQAYVTKSVLDGEHIDRIICSPLRRAKETAAIINAGRNLPVVYDERVLERNFGELEGLRIPDFDYPSCWSYKKNNSYRNAERMSDFFDRIFSFLDSIREEYRNQTVLIVAHGGVSIPVRCYFEGIPDMDSLIGLFPENCTIARRRSGGRYPRTLEY